MIFYDFFIIKRYLSKLFLETVPISEDFLYQHKGSLSILTGIAAMITYIWFVRVHQYHCTNVLEILAWSMFDFSLLGRCTLHAKIRWAGGPKSIIENWRLCSCAEDACMPRCSVPPAPSKLERHWALAVRLVGTVKTSFCKI